MKALKKLIPAAAMLVLCAAMMTTATFAWFTTRSSVDGNVSDITVVGPQNLSIKSTATDSVYGSTATAKVNSNGLNPATTTNAVALDTWGTSRAGKTGDADISLTLDTTGKATAATPAVASSGVDTNWAIDKFFFNDYVFYLKNESSDDSANDMSVTFDYTTVTISATSTAEGGGAAGTSVKEAVTFAIIVGNQVKAIYEGGSGTVHTGSFNASSSAAAPVIIDKLVKNVEQTVTIRVWIEGKNPACIDDNYVKDVKYSLKVAFKATTVAKTPVTP